jgi:tetratricopeptide (TPR) repeat protein
MAGFELPTAPGQLTGAVKAWSRPVVIPWYPPAAADKNPMFLERRVYQGSSGRLYPLPFIDRIEERKVDRAWEAVHIENEHLRLMILPEIGGRIHVGLDKHSGYDFFYRQNVIKPALVGLAGPWISGGVEFNWPQHHRPSTFMPVDVAIEEDSDGSITVWCSEHEPMNRMKGMHGVCLHPGKSVIELKVRLFNRTPLVQTFLWWANVAARVHEDYQSFFPEDVVSVADHAKRATSRFPLCDGYYYGVDYAGRARNGTPVGELPRQFAPRADVYPPNDLSRYANIPVPTSYMAIGSREDFFGGYDFAADAGLVHVSNRHISPGKKQWTWGNHEFGYAWDRNLTDADGPYIELMAGVYTDNQPDFSFLHPGETRTFNQYWYPIQKIGPAHRANLDAAISLRIDGSKARVGVAVSSHRPGAVVELGAGGENIATIAADIAPGNPFVREIELPAGVRRSDIRLSVIDRDAKEADSQEIISYAPADSTAGDLPKSATEPPPPEEIASADELFLTGLHLEQYRHATRDPELYWREALRRDPNDSRCNNAVGLRHLRRGEFARAADPFRRAIDTITRLNPNPIDGEPYYNLGLALRFLGDEQGAYDAFYKSTWNQPWQPPAFFALAEIGCRRKNWTAALEHLDRALRVNADHLQARDLKVMVLRQLGRDDAAAMLLEATRRLDPLDWWSHDLAGQPLHCDAQIRLDLALDYARSGFYSQAITVFIESKSANATDGTAPLVQYYLAYFYDQIGDRPKSKAALAAATPARRDYCFPSRLEEIAILRFAIGANPLDAAAPYYLANLLYDRRRHHEAIELWETSARLDPSCSIVWRNLGIGYFNILKDAEKSKDAYDRAIAANPDDARLLYERDQLWKRLGIATANRLAELERFGQLVARRDDLTIELCALYSQAGRHNDARKLLVGRNFQPWEGGEGLVLGQHVRTHLALARVALADGRPLEALQLLQACLDPPLNLGEARHLLSNASDVHLFLGDAALAGGDRAAAVSHWSIAADYRGDFQEMSVRRHSEMTYWSAIAMQRLGRDDDAKNILQELLSFAADLQKTPARIDYFATSLPATLLFNDDLDRRQCILAEFLTAQARLGLRRADEAVEKLRHVLQLDPGHAQAADLLASIRNAPAATMHPSSFAEPSK